MKTSYIFNSFASALRQVAFGALFLLISILLFVVCAITLHESGYSEEIVTLSSLSVATLVLIAMHLGLLRIELSRARKKTLSVFLSGLSFKQRCERIQRKIDSSKKELELPLRDLEKAKLQFDEARQVLLSFDKNLFSDKQSREVRVLLATIDDWDQQYLMVKSAIQSRLQYLDEMEQEAKSIAQDHKAMVSEASDTSDTSPDEMPYVLLSESIEFEFHTVKALRHYHEKVQEQYEDFRSNCAA